MKLQFFKQKEEALQVAKQKKAYVIYSMAPGERSPSTAKEWGYWVEKEPEMIRAWETEIYSPH